MEENLHKYKDTWKFVERFAEACDCQGTEAYVEKTNIIPVENVIRNSELSVGVERKEVGKREREMGSTK